MSKTIIFSGEMVRAILDGRKTQSRRLAWRKDGKSSIWQKARPGDRLWVREAFALPHAGRSAVRRRGRDVIAYRADEGVRHGRLKQYDGRWKPSIHMPRWASRLTLVVTGVKTERVRSILENEALAEGVDPIAEQGAPVSYRKGFAALWESLHGRDSWEANPEVVALAFTVHAGNIDALEAREAGCG